jgi:hypothetical protein
MHHASQVNGCFILIIRTRSLRNVQAHWSPRERTVKLLYERLIQQKFVQVYICTFLCSCPQNLSTFLLGSWAASQWKNNSSKFASCTYPNPWHVSSICL